MTYVVRLGDRLWLKEANLDPLPDDDLPGDRIIGTSDPEEAIVFTDAVGAAREISRVSTAEPLAGCLLRQPLLLAGASVQHIDEAREEGR